jgi:glycosyltransferase involved in cell wall biosynthesis
MKIAFVHDWYNVNGGAEKVASEILDLFKDDTIVIYTLFDSLKKTDRQELFKGHKVVTTLLNYIPFRSRLYRFLLPLMPLFMKMFYIHDYDMIISSSHAIARGFRKKKDLLHICYCHTPMRYIWDMCEEYASSHKLGKSFFYKKLVRGLRRWDVQTAAGVDYFIANSVNVQNRIRNNYNRDSTVIYPPVRVNRFSLNTAARQDYYLCVGRFVPYKKMDLALSAFSKMPDRKLVIIGAGYGSKKIKKMLQQHPNIQWLGYVPDDTVIQHMQQAKACIFAAKEDFGIVCVEAQACGTPVLALRYGGYLETVVEGQTGYFFEDQTEEQLIRAVQRFEQQPLDDHELIRMHTLRFSEQRFRDEMNAFVHKAQSDFIK